jgi:NhaP-type Na+/H+ or K+/H+ antiporter
MTEPLFLGLAGIIVLGIAAQWLAWYLRVPSIFLLLLAVIAAFAVTNHFCMTKPGCSPLR